MVPDPWFGGEDGFHKVYEMIDEACEAIVKATTLKGEARKLQP